MPKLMKFAWLAVAGTLIGQTTPPASTPVEMVVTTGHSFGRVPPAFTRDDVMVTQNWEPLVITSLIPLRGDRAGLELFVVVDNCSNCEPGSVFEDLRRFLMAQPATTAIGVASIDGGRLKVIETPTPDHARAVKALSVPTGDQPISPFPAVTKLIKGWAQGASHRAVLLISNGIDPEAKGEYQSESAETALETAQRGGVTVYAIYHPSADYATTDASRLYSGQVQLAHLATETGGEAYFLGFGPLPSAAPLLADLAEHLANRYLLQFLVSPAEGRGELRDITVKSKIDNLDLMVPNKVWVPGRPSGSSGRSSRGGNQ